MILFGSEPLAKQRKSQHGEETHRKARPREAMDQAYKNLKAKAQRPTTQQYTKKKQRARAHTHTQNTVVLCERAVETV